MMATKHIAMTTTPAAPALATTGMRELGAGDEDVMVGVEVVEGDIVGAMAGDREGENERD